VVEYHVNLVWRGYSKSSLLLLFMDTFHEHRKFVKTQAIASRARPPTGQSRRKSSTRRGDSRLKAGFAADLSSVGSRSLFCRPHMGLG